MAKTGEPRGYWVCLGNHPGLTRKAVRRGAFVSLPDLIQAIDAFLAASNQNPRRFVWTARVEDIMAKLQRAKTKLEMIEPGCTQSRKRQKNEE